MDARSGLSNIQWIAIVATGLLIGVGIMWGVYSGVIDDVVGTLEQLFGAGSDAPGRTQDPFNETAAPASPGQPGTVSLAAAGPPRGVS